MGRRLLRAVLALLGLAIATAGFYPEILTPGRILADYDVWTYFYPLRAYAVGALQSGRFPLWNPDLFLGAPFFANPQTALLYPGTLLFLILPIPYAYSLSVVVHVFLVASFTYAFLRLVLGVGAWPGLLGASAFAFGGAVSAQVGHINQLSATPWLPAVALCVDLAYRRHSFRWAAAGALALGIQLLAGHAQVTYMTAWVMALLLAWRFIESAHPGEAPAASGFEDEASPTTERDEPTSATVAPAAADLARGTLVMFLVAVPAAALAAVQLLPTAELAGESIRGGGLPYAEAVAFSLPPNLALRALLPGYWANLSSTEYLGYVGIIPLFFALLAVAFSVSSTAIFATGVATIALLLSLGGALPGYGALLPAVPGLDLFRVPARWLLVYSFGSACLTAIGVQWALTRPLPTPRIWRPPAVMGAVALLAMAFVPLLQGVPGRIVSLWMLSFFAAAVLAVLSLRMPGRVMALVMTVLTLGELRLAAIALPARSAVPAEAYGMPRDVPRHLLQGRDGRILSIAPTEYEVPDAPQIAEQYPGLSPDALFLFKTALKLDEVMSPNVPLHYGLATVDGYDGGVLPLRRYLEIASLLAPRDQLRSDGVLRTRLAAPPDERLLDLFGITSVIALQRTEASGAGLRESVFPPLKVYERKPTDPDLLALIPTGVALSDQATLDALRGDPGSARGVVRLAEGSAVATEPRTAGARFRRLPSWPERLHFVRVGGPGAGYLVVDDAWFPGWRAWVDGEEARLFRANVLFKAVWVPDEAQEVILAYEPESVRLGAALSALGIAAIIALFALGVRGRRLGPLGYNP